MADKPASELHWFPFFAKDWLSSPAVQAMRPEQRGAYIQLLALAWGSGDREPSIEASAAPRLSGLGSRWKMLGGLVLEQFEEYEGCLFNDKLTEVWKAQQTRHSQAVADGKRGGYRKHKRSKPSSPPSSLPSSQAVAQGVAVEKQSESETEPEGQNPLLSGARVLSLTETATTAAGSLAPEGALPAEPTKPPRIPGITKGELSPIGSSPLLRRLAGVPQ